MKLRNAIVIPTVILAGLVLASPALAQRGIGAKSGPAGRAASRGSVGGGAFRFAHPARPMFRGRGRGYGRGLAWGSGWGYTPYLDYGPYADYGPYGDYGGYADYAPGMTPAPPWQSEPQPVLADQPERLVQPMLLERQGDQWVKVTGYSEAPAASQSQGQSRDEAAEPPREIPPAVLVFRDGHQEEVKRYTIIGGTLFAKVDYYANGTWTRRIEIANLDVPATLKLNDERGSKFRLPSGPQEVMIRP